LYNKDRSPIGLRKLDSENNNFKDMEAGENDYEGNLLSGSTKCKIMISCAQEGTGDPVVTELQSYTEVLRMVGLDDVLKLYKNFYLNKAFYNNKILIFKDSFDIIYPTKKDDTLIGNISNSPCQVFKNKLDLEEFDSEAAWSLPANESMRALLETVDSEGEVSYPTSEQKAMLRPKHLLSDNSKITVITQPADIEYEGTVDGLKVINASSKAVNITADGKTNKIYSSEKIAFTSSTKLDYNLCPRFNRRDWFIGLKDVHIPHQHKDTSYFNEEENNAEWVIKKKNSFNVNYVGVRYKFSNMFRTNLYWPAKVASGYESISEFDNPYKFGITFYGDKKSSASSLLDYGLERKEVYYGEDSSDYILNGLKLSWDMPARTIGYSVSTGHESICYSKEFNERTGLVTVSGIENGKYYVLDDFDQYYLVGEAVYPTKYDFATTADRDDHGNIYTDAPEANLYKYRNVVSKEFHPTIWYNGKQYGPGEKFIGLSEKKDYQIHYNYFAIVKASMFKAEGVAESDSMLKEIAKKDAKDINDELANKANDDTTSYVPPTWSKVSKSYQKNDFLNGRLKSKINNGNSLELIQGKKLKDIEGTFEEDYFEFKILKDSSLTFTHSFSDIEWTNKNNSTDKEYILRVKFADNKIDSPGYEYEIQSSLSFENNTGGVVLSISLNDRDSLPFVAVGAVKSVNLDSIDQKYVTREGGSTYDSDITRVLNMSERDRSKSLKHQQGYSFIPFGIISEEKQVGLSFISSRKKKSYGAIRLRLKKLTEKRLIFENLKKDLGVGGYLTSESKTAGLQYHLDTEVNSITYHDIFRPGGVLKFSGTNRDWRTIGATSSDQGDAYLSSNQLVVRGAVSDGDAIVFKNSNGSIVGGKPYFARVTSQTTNGNELKNTITLLKIFSKDASLDGFNKVDGDIEDTVSSADEGNNEPGQAFKVVNYFDLETEDDGTHRSEKSILPKLYEGPDSKESKVTSLNYPIVIGSRTFFLEPALTKDINGLDISSGSWPTSSVINGKTIRANLELSSIAKHWHGESSGGRGFGNIVGIDHYVREVSGDDAIPEIHWRDEDIFSSWKNLLYRSNTQIQRVNYDETTVTLNIKLNTNQGYRYIYKKSRSELSLNSSNDINSITLNGLDLGVETSGVIFNTTEDLKIVLNYKNTDEANSPSSKVKVWGYGQGESLIRSKVFEGLCIIEEPDYISDFPAMTDGDNGEDLAGSDYFDYQIPELNNVRGEKFKQIHDSFETEGHDHLLSYGQKGENLAPLEGTSPISSSDPFTAGLFYNMGMPAICSYIYPYVSSKNNQLSFYIDDFWKGFAHGFGDSRESHRVKPVSFKYNLEDSPDGVSWSSVQAGLVHRGGGFAVKREGLDDSKKYRMAITNVEISYYDTDKYAIKDIPSIRLPFKWRSTIYDSDLSGDGVYNDEIGMYQHSLSVVENPVIKKSVSFPESGLVKLGEFNFKKEYYFDNEKTFIVPCSRLYMFNLDYNMIASYKDPINRGGISKVVITDSGDNYRVPPTISIEAPDNKLPHFRKADLSSKIENGKLKFVKVDNAGTGYADINEFKTVRMEQFRSDITPTIIHNLKIAEVTSNQERSLDHILITDVPGLKLYKATITENESSLPKEEQEEFGLTFDETERIAEFKEYEDLKASVNRGTVDFMKGSAEDNKEWLDIQAQADRIMKIKSFTTSAIEQTKESKNYGRFLPDEISEIKGTENEYIDGLFEASEADSSSTENRTVEIKVQPGSDRPFIQYEVYPSVDPGEAWALANNSSIAEYRIIDNEVATKAAPWISSLSREDDPSHPQSFGVFPGAPVTAEVFNSYARAINNLHKIRVEAPLYAKVRRFKQVEYRYINNPDMAGLTFPPDINVEDAGNTKSWWDDNYKESGYLTYDNKSRVNWITYRDPSSNKIKTAHFSAFEAENNHGKGKGILRPDEKGGTQISEDNPENITDSVGWGESSIWDEVDGELRDTEQGRKFKKQNTDAPVHKTPKSVGLPSEVNIPKELGVHCDPPGLYEAQDTYQPIKGEGIPLPSPSNRRAFAYGGELVYQSEIFDVSDEQTPLKEGILYSYGGGVGNDTFEPIMDGVLVDIRGSEYIKAGYSNQIVFGCQVRGKPFMSAFLRTVKVWTDYEVVSSPGFTKSLPAGIKERYKPEESNLRCNLIEGRTTCEEGKLGEVYKRNGYHSVCEDGRQSQYNSEYSYEDLFNLSEGDDVIGPKENYTERYSSSQIPAKGVFKVEPEFDLALAVYGSNEFVSSVRKGPKGHGSAAFAGPCVHYCYPGQIQTLKVSSDPLIFDLKK
tara:strand:- start:542 stop:7405 length:6864 start_codon:yes stop_codon:yes gene_type:complete